MTNVTILNPPLKSEDDTKEYRLIRLQNGLKALLVRKVNSAENKDDLLAAAALTVRVGSFDEPSKALGLAHFLEHMVHMGCQKFPDENGYYDFITSNGGTRNATTGTEMTSYYFNVAETVFPDALDRFAQMIQSPLLSESSMQREREAVDSEFNMNKALDAAGYQSILKTLMYQTHRASRFDFGNLKTLKDDISDDDLRSELLKLHAKYIANKMYLAVQSSRTLDDLQDLVVKRFSGIKKGVEKNENSTKNPTKLEEIFKPEFYNKIYFMKPKSNIRGLLLSWTLPSILKDYKCSPLEYISHFLTNEREGAIGSYLKERHYITEIGTLTEKNDFSSNSDFTLVRIYIALTASGCQNIDKVLEALASYLLMMKETPIEDHRRVYEDLKDKSEAGFDFHKEGDSMDNVLEFATNMLNYDEVDILRGNSVFQEFNEELILQCISALNERKFNLIIVNDKHDRFDKKEKYFETQYDVQDFPKAYETIWKEKKRIFEFAVEEPNPFNPTNYEIFINENESTKYPVIILANDILKVWHTLDNKFNRPYAYFKVQLISPIVESSKKNYLTMVLFGKILQYYLEEKTYQAKNAGYEVAVNTDRTGLSLTFEGLNDKIPLVIDTVTSLIRNCVNETVEATFETAKEELMEKYANLLMSLESINNDVLNKTVLSNHFSPLDLLDDFDHISFDNVQTFTSKFFQKMKMQMLAQGNITKIQALNIAAIIEKNFNGKAFTEAYVPKRRAYHLPVGSSVVRFMSLLPNDDNSFIRNHYQIGRDTLRTINFARLLAAVLSPKAFDFLRSKEQLGYSVDFQVATRGNAVGIDLIVLSQEHKHQYSQVCRKMDFFMNQIAKKAIEELTDEDFESVKEARMKKLLADDQDLDVEVGTNWFEIKQQDYEFNRLEMAAKFTKNLTKRQLQDFFKSFTQPENMRKLSIHVIGNHGGSMTKNDSEFEIKYLTEKVTEDENIITNIEEFQNELYLYPVEMVQK